MKASGTTKVFELTPPEGDLEDGLQAEVLVFDPAYPPAAAATDPPPGTSWGEETVPPPSAPPIAPAPKPTAHCAAPRQPARGSAGQQQWAMYDSSFGRDRVRQIATDNLRLLQRLTAIAAAKPNRSSDLVQHDRVS